jgi:hypothetical protein
MQDFPANSQKARDRAEGPPQTQRPKKIEQVTSAQADRRPRGLGRRFKETFVGGSARGAIDYMILEVVIPAVQDTMIDAFQGGVERLIRGESRPRRSGSMPYSNPPRIDYSKFNTNSPPTSRTISRQSRTRHDFGEIVIQQRQEAEEVIDRMFDILSRYGTVTVADLYELTGIQSGHTDTKWGWTSLRGAKATRMRSGGFLLDLPEPESLER